jgi:hypothetical protein
VNLHLHYGFRVASAGTGLFFVGKESSFRPKNTLHCQLPLCSVYEPNYTQRLLARISVKLNSVLVWFQFSQDRVRQFKRCI